MNTYAIAIVSYPRQNPGKSLDLRRSAVCIATMHNNIPEMTKITLSNTDFVEKDW